MASVPTAPLGGVELPRLPQKRHNPSQRLGTLGKVKFTCRLVVIHVDSLQLQVALPVVRPGRVDAMFVAYHLPELEAGKENKGER